jgi:hypothetical protein
MDPLMDPTTQADCLWSLTDTPEKIYSNKIPMRFNRDWKLQAPNEYPDERNTIQEKIK